MMSRILVNPGKLRSLSASFQVKSENIYTLATQLRNGTNTLDWETRCKSNIDDQVNHACKQARDLAAHLQELSSHLKTKVQAFEDADRKGADELNNLIDNFKLLLAPPGVCLLPNPNEILTIQSVLDLLNKDAGKELLEECRENGLAFQMPDGSIFPPNTNLNNPKIRIIIVRVGPLMDANAHYSESGNEILINQEIFNKKNENNFNLNLSGLVAHEIQHALDDTKESFTRYIPPHFVTEEYLQDDLSKFIDKQIASEVRAYERQKAILNNIEYRDDGIVTRQEKIDILEIKQYAIKYEEWMNAFLSDPNNNPPHRVDVTIDSSGNLSVNLITLPCKSPAHPKFEKITVVPQDKPINVF